MVRPSRSFAPPVLRIHGVYCVVTTTAILISALSMASPDVSRILEDARCEEWRRSGVPSVARCTGRVGPDGGTLSLPPHARPAWWMRAVAVGELEGIDVFQAEFPGYGIAAGWLPDSQRTRAQPSFSTTLSGTGWPNGHDVRHIKRVEQWVLEQVDDIIAVSEDDKRRMVEAGTAPEDRSCRTVWTQVASERRRVRCARASRHSRDAPLLMFHGTLHYWPNTEVVRFIVESLLPLLYTIQTFGSW